MLMASTSDCEVEVSSGLAGLESQGQGRVPHPVVGGAIRPSCRTGLGRCSAVPVVITWRSRLVCAGVHRDGVCPEMAVLSVLAE